MNVYSKGNIFLNEETKIEKGRRHEGLMMRKREEVYD